MITGPPRGGPDPGTAAPAAWGWERSNSITVTAGINPLRRMSVALAMLEPSTSVTTHAADSDYDVYGLTVTAKTS
jgi:hypothetical protein